LNDHPKGTYEPIWGTAKVCARKEFRKNETFTAHEFHKRCRIDYYTATKYLPLLEGEDLGEGKRIVSTDVVTKGYVMDPLGEDSLKAANSECCRVCGCDQVEKVNAEDNSWRNYWRPILFFGFLIGLAAYAFKRSVFTCTSCRTPINVIGLREPSFRCPVCQAYCVRQSAH